MHSTPPHTSWIEQLKALFQRPLLPLTRSVRSQPPSRWWRRRACQRRCAEHSRYHYANTKGVPLTEARLLTLGESSTLMDCATLKQKFAFTFFFVFFSLLLFCFYFLFHWKPQHDAKGKRSRDRNDHSHIKSLGCEVREKSIYANTTAKKQCDWKSYGCLVWHWRWMPFLFLCFYWHRLPRYLLWEAVGRSMCKACLSVCECPGVAQTHLLPSDEKWMQDSRIGWTSWEIDGAGWPRTILNDCSGGMVPKVTEIYVFVWYGVHSRS